MTSSSYFDKMNSNLGSVVPLAMFLLTGHQTLFSKICQLMLVMMLMVIMMVMLIVIMIKVMNVE